MTQDPAEHAVSMSDRTIGAATHSGPAFMVLTFELDCERFAIPIQNVQEVIDPLELTLVPNADPFAPGLINVRGTVVPVLSLQHRLNIRQSEHDAETRYIVVEAEIEEELTKFAIIADSVHEVVEFPESSLHGSPQLGLDWPHDYIEGIINEDETMIILINVNRIFAPDPAAAQTE